MPAYIPLSQRNAKNVPSPLGLDEMPPELRIDLWNVIQSQLVKTRTEEEHRDRHTALYRLKVLRWSTDEVPDLFHSSRVTTRLKAWFNEASAADIYDLMEGFPRAMFAGVGVNLDSPKSMSRESDDFDPRVAYSYVEYIVLLNSMLERNLAPYRLNDKTHHLEALTNAEEIAAVGAARGGPARFAPAMAHIEEAVGHLSARPPNYPDSIKQSISALESVLRIALDGSSEKMGPLLVAFTKKYGDIHPAIVDLIDKLYGYASNEGGIRHAAKGPVTIGESEARCLLVSCSALMNYLMQKAAKKV